MNDEPPAAVNEEPRPPGLIRREFREAVLRTRQVLDGSDEEAAEAVLDQAARVSVHSEAEATIVAELAPHPALAQPDRFLAAHRRTMQALEVLERDGGRGVRVASWGQLAPIAVYAIQNIGEYIIASFSDDVVSTLRVLYGRREVQSPEDSPERGMLKGARDEVLIVSPDYGNGGGLVRLLIGGAAIPVVGWLGDQLGAFDFDGRFLLVSTVVLAVIFVALAWLMLQGAALAHRRSRLIMQAPLAELWETIGHCGSPPEDNGRDFALVAIGLTGLIWFVLPAIAFVALLLL